MAVPVSCGVLAEKPGPRSWHTARGVITVHQPSAHRLAVCCIHVLARCHPNGAAHVPCRFCQGGGGARRARNTRWQQPGRVRLLVDGLGCCSCFVALLLSWHALSGWQGDEEHNPTYTLECRHPKQRGLLREATFSSGVRAFSFTGASRAFFVCVCPLLCQQVQLAGCCCRPP